MGPQKALETIGANLQKQYENWQPRVSLLCPLSFLMRGLWLLGAQSVNPAGAPGVAPAVLHRAPHCACPPVEGVVSCSSVYLLKFSPESVHFQ